MPNGDPALVYERPGQSPGTHVLLIGVGAYTYLLDGDQENENAAEGMGQLASPPPSVRAIADWFLSGNFENPERPLASLAMVISETLPATYAHPQATFAGHNLPAGNVDDVAAAIESWLGRASDHRDNQVIFFFTGHGIFSGNSVLLCRDYGRTKATRFEGAINFDNFRGAMSSMVPEYQLFFVDACRTPDKIINSLLGIASAGRSILAAEDLADRGGTLARQSVHFATSSLEPSWGRSDGVSIYTDALLRALSGGGAQSDLSWWVGTNGLQTALAAYTSRIASEAAVEQAPDRTHSQQFKVHQPKSIEVPVFVTFSPSVVADETFRIEARRNGMIEKHYAHDGAIGSVGKGWQMSLALDKYDIAACFEPASVYREAVTTILAVPPEAPCQLPVMRKDQP